MADGYYHPHHHEQQHHYHVPQQSRRDKLRVHLNHPSGSLSPQPAAVLHADGGVGVLQPPPLYDPQDLLTYAPHNMMMMSSTSTSPSNYGLINNPNYSDDHHVPYIITNNLNNQGGLSLSLSSHNTHNTLFHEINFERYGGDHVSRSLSSASCVPLGPFTGYASILKGSRFLKPAQQLLEELCDLGDGVPISFHKIAAAADASIMMDFNSLDDASVKNEDFFGSGDARKSRLISMLDEVLRRYKQYYQQMQTVVASFETVSGLSNAAPYANLALKVMSKHFKCMKNAISEQLQFANKVHTHTSKGKDEAPTTVYGQRLDHTLGLINEHQPVWRPQRGLPERAVSVLRAWLFEHFLHPYPTDTDKVMLAKQTGLSRNQVSNWFINARVRLWKPMVEEIHMLETRESQKTSTTEERNDNNNSSRPIDPLTSDNPSASSTQHLQEHNPFKRNRYEFTHLPMGSDERVNVAYTSLPNHPNVVGTSGSVSLTLGLPQNNAIGQSEPFHINSEGYVMGGYEATNRHFGRGDGMGSQQLMHDFVG